MSLSFYPPMSLGHRLRPSDRALLAIPRPRQKTKGDRALAVRAPTLWNNLPESVPSFILLLKTHFYFKKMLLLCDVYFSFICIWPCLCFIYCCKLMYNGN